VGTHGQHGVIETIFDSPIATILIVVLLAAGGLDIALDGELSKDWREFVETIAIPLAGLALGRGWAARKPG
jgi:hypothetical protein